MSKSSADEQKKQETAQRVVTPKRKYFFPNEGVVIEAASMEAALKTLNSKVEGDQENE